MGTDGIQSGNSGFIKVTSVSTINFNMASRIYLVQNISHFVPGCISQLLFLVIVKKKIKIKNILAVIAVK